MTARIIPHPALCARRRQLRANRDYFLRVAADYRERSQPHGVLPIVRSLELRANEAAAEMREIDERLRDAVFAIPAMPGREAHHG